MLLLLALALLLFFRKRLISGAAVVRHPESGHFRASVDPFFRVLAAEAPPRTCGRGQREQSLIREDRSDALAFPE